MRETLHGEKARGAMGLPGRVSFLVPECKQRMGLNRFMGQLK